MIARDRLLQKYADWCIDVQKSEASQGFPVLSWVGGPAVRASFEYIKKESLRPGDFFIQLLKERLSDQYDSTIAVPGATGTIDYANFNQFRLAYLDERMTDVNFAYAVMRRTQNRKRDRAVVRETQASLEAVGWKKYRLTPSELGASFRIDLGAELNLLLSLPHGSLEFEYVLVCDGEKWLWAESYISWFGLSGSTEVWGSTEDPEGLSSFVENQSCRFLEFLQSCCD